MYFVCKSKLHFILTIFVLHLHLLWSIQATDLPCPNNCVCSSLEQSLTAAKCDRFPKLEELNDDLRILRIESIDECPISKTLKKFTQLKALSVSNCVIDVKASTFSTLSHLENVTFFNTSLQAIDPLSFETNRNLKTVNLSSNPLKILRHLLISASIEEVNLSNCELTEIPKKAFLQILNLKRLILSDNELETLNNVLPNSLRFIDLSNNNFEDIPLRAIQPLENLNEINIDGNPLVCSCKLKLTEKYLSLKNISFTKPINCITPDNEFVSLNEISLKDICMKNGNLKEKIFVNEILKRIRNRRSVNATNSIDSLSLSNKTLIEDSLYDEFGDIANSSVTFQARFLRAESDPTHPTLHHTTEDDESPDDKDSDDKSPVSVKGILLILALTIVVLLILVVVIMSVLFSLIMKKKSNHDDSAAVAAAVQVCQMRGEAANPAEFQTLMSTRCPTRKGTCRICPSTISSKKSATYSTKSVCDYNDVETDVDESLCASQATSSYNTYRHSSRC